MKDENRNMVMQSLSLYMLSKQKCKNALQELKELNFSKMMQAGKQSTKKENILCKFNPALGNPYGTVILSAKTFWNVFDYTITTEPVLKHPYITTPDWEQWLRTSTFH